MSAITITDGLAVSRFLFSHLTDFIRPGLTNPSSVQIEEKQQNWQGADFVTTLDTVGQDKIAGFLSHYFARFEPYICGEEGFGDFKTAQGVSQIASNIARMKKGFSAIIDPIDGTNNVKRFLSGEESSWPRYGVMTSLFYEGQPAASFVLAEDGGQTTLSMAIKGKGAYWVSPDTQNMTRITLDQNENSSVPHVMTVLRAWHSDYQQIIIESQAGGLVTIEQNPPVSAAVETNRFLQGKADAAGWRRNTLWDQTQALLLTQEAGGTGYLLDGTSFALESFHSNGVLIARNDNIWGQVVHALIGEGAYAQCYNDKELVGHNMDNRERRAKLSDALKMQ